MPRGRSSTEDVATLQMALVGYQIERQKIDDKIRELESQLKGRRGSSAIVGSSAAKKAPRAKRVLSAAARRRIGAAQKKRWAEHRKRPAQAAK